MSNELPASGPPTRGWLIGVIGAVLVLALAAAAYVQSRQFQLLNLTVQYQDDYLMVSLTQLETEYLRLEGQWREALREEPLNRPALQLRYDIFVSRIGLLETERAARLIKDRREFDDTTRQLRAFVSRADLYLGEKPRAELSRDTLASLMVELQALNEPIHTLALDASHHVAAQVARRNLTVRQHNQVGIGLTLLLSVTTLVFALMTMRQMRQLEDRRRGLEELAAHLREARHEAEAASQAKSVFLANMSHEIRTPFQGLLGMLSLLRDTPLQARQLDFLRTATESADHLLVILNDILDMSKLESGTLALALESVDLARLVGDVESLMRPQAMAKGLALRVEMEPGLPARVMADATRVRQVLFNLMSNALKFSDSGSVTLGVRRAAAQLEFSVVDTGTGMDAATLARLFQRFTQGDESRSRRHGGTGLGLEISRNLARLMGGDIRVHSAPGAGSTFVFVLPLQEAPPEPADPAAVLPAAAATQALCVLVAEDHPVNRKYLAALLERLGHQATFVENGWEAVQAAQGPAGAGFDIVLMDLHMPVLDGVGAAQAIRALPGSVARVPIVTLTADAFQETRERCLAAGMNDFLTKPVNLQELAAMFARHFGTPQRGQAPSAGPADGLPAEDEHVLDLVVLDSVLSVIPHDRFETLAAGFLAESAAVAKQMRTQIERGEHEELRRAAHANKGAALNLGLKALAEAAQQLNLAAAHGDAVALAGLVDDFEARIGQGRAAMERQGLLARQAVNA